MNIERRRVNFNRLFDRVAEFNTMHNANISIRTNDIYSIIYMYGGWERFDFVHSGNSISPTNLMSYLVNIINGEEVLFESNMPIYAELDEDCYNHNGELIKKRGDDYIIGWEVNKRYKLAPLYHCCTSRNAPINDGNYQLSVHYNYDNYLKSCKIVTKEAILDFLNRNGVCGAVLKINTIRFKPCQQRLQPDDMSWVLIESIKEAEEIFHHNEIITQIFPHLNSK